MFTYYKTYIQIMYFEIKYTFKNVSFWLFFVGVVIFPEAKMYNDIIPSFIFEGNIGFFIWIYCEDRQLVIFRKLTSPKTDWTNSFRRKITRNASLGGGSIKKRKASFSRYFLQCIVSQIRQMNRKMNRVEHLFYAKWNNMHWLLYFEHEKNGVN